MRALNPFLRAMPPRKDQSCGWISGGIRLRRCLVEKTQWINSETYVCAMRFSRRFQAFLREAVQSLTSYPALKRRAIVRRPPEAFSFPYLRTIHDTFPEELKSSFITFLQ